MGFFVNQDGNHFLTVKFARLHMSVQGRTAATGREVMGNKKMQNTPYGIIFFPAQPGRKGEDGL